MSFFYPVNHRGDNILFWLFFFFLNGRSAPGGQKHPFFRDTPTTFVAAHLSTSHLHQVKGLTLNVSSPERSPLYFSVQTNYKMGLGWKCLEGGAAPTRSGPCGWKPLSHAGSSWCVSSLALLGHQSTAEGHYSLLVSGHHQKVLRAAVEHDKAHGMVEMGQRK